MCESKQQNIQTPIEASIVEKTDRGFEFFELGDDRYNKMVVQQSSAVGEYEDSFDRPGSSYLGVRFKDPDAKIQMAHLSREEVAGLVTRCEAWLGSGSFLKAVVGEEYGELVDLLIEEELDEATVTITDEDPDRVLGAIRTRCQDRGARLTLRQLGEHTILITRPDDEDGGGA